MRVLALCALAFCGDLVAATFTVTSTADVAGSSCGADCSLRQALTAANNAAGSDTVAFNISGSGPHRIILNSVLGSANNVIIDGYSQPGAIANSASAASNAVLQIIVDGSSLANTTGAMLSLGGTGSRVSGLSIVGDTVDQGIFLLSGDAAISGCWLGVEPDGVTLRGNRGGLRLFGNNRVGGNTVADRNVLVGTSSFPVIRGESPGQSGQIENNLLGLLPDGITPAPNNRGIEGISGTGQTVIGNTISCSLTNSLVNFGNVVQNNRIGTTADGENNPGCTSGTAVPLSGARWLDNVLAHQSGRALNLNSNALVGVVVSRNRMFNNATYHLDLGNDGFTVNDAGDADTGPNNRQNHPLITNAERGLGSSVTVSGTLNSLPNSGFRVEFFAAADFSRVSGSILLADAQWVATESVDVNTDANGDASFGPTLLNFPGSGFIAAVSASATRLDGGGNPVETSEYGPARAAFSAGLSSFVVTNTQSSGAGSFRQAFLEADAHPDEVVRDRISFAIPGSGPHSLSVAGLSDLSSAGRLEIDGSSQLGHIANTLPLASNAQLAIELNGLRLQLSNADVLVRGLAMRGPSALLSLSSGVLEGSFVGVSLDGNSLSSTFGNTAQINCSGACRIGGSTPSQRNVIGCPGTGAMNCLNLQGNSAVVEGNLIGLRSNGLVRLLSPVDPGTFQAPVGIAISGQFIAVRNNTIGGLTYGIQSSATNNLFEGNRLGVGVDGQTAAGNARSGIHHAFGGARLLGNHIANNGRDGVLLGGASSFATLIENTIRNNGELGLDLDLTGLLHGDGESLNDALDADTGGNNGQNFPQLSNAMRDTDSLQASVSLHSLPNTAFRLRYCHVLAADSSGHGECDQPIIGIAQTITTDANGNFTGNTPDLPLLAGATGLVATAGRIAGIFEESSEFSAVAQLRNSTSTQISAISPNPAVFGQAVQVSVQVVSPLLGGISGSVMVEVAGGGSCTATVKAGLASCSLVPGNVGSSNISASYTGDSQFAPSSTLDSLTVNRAPTSTTITADTPDPSTFGGAITVNVGVSSAHLMPDGVVSISDGGAAQCEATLSGAGNGSCVLSPGSGGALMLSASYAGNTRFESSSASEPHQVNPVASALVITGDTPDPSVFGQPVLVSADLSSSVGTPAGPILISDGSGASCEISGTSGSCNLVPGNSGALTLRADFGGNSNHSPSTASISHDVNRATTQLEISAVGVPGTGGLPRELGPLRFPLLVQVLAPGAGVPGGSVSVSANPGNEVCVIVLPAEACELIVQLPGQRHFELSYPGDANFLPSTGAIDVLVQPDRLFVEGFEAKEE